MDEWESVSFTTNWSKLAGEKAGIKPSPLSWPTELWKARTYVCMEPSVFQ